MMTLEDMNKPLTDNPVYLYNDNGDRFDISSQPMIDEPLLLNAVESDLLNRKTNDFKYEFNGVKVPRVTAIIKYCTGNVDGLVRWAANLGPKYYTENAHILDIGTKVHETIEEQLTKGTQYTLRRTSTNIRNEVKQCVHNFMAWYNHVTKNLGWIVEVMLIEVPLVCPWFGGTADLVLKINGINFLIDLKTSKKITPDYFIQVSAYKWVIDNFYPEYGPIDGVGVLRLDKYSNKYEDVFIDINTPEDIYFINHCLQTFGIALNMYYQMNILAKETTNIIKTKTKSKNKKGSKEND